jgi:hypothetical protein
MLLSAENTPSKIGLLMYFASGGAYIIKPALIVFPVSILETIPLVAEQYVSLPG